MENGDHAQPVVWGRERARYSSAMKIHGLRIYPRSIQVMNEGDSLIFLHGRLSNDRSDFAYIFHPLSQLCAGRFVATEIGIGYSEKGEKIDPTSDLRAAHGDRFVAVDVESSLMLLHADELPIWGPVLVSAGGAFLPIFSARPEFKLLKHLYWTPGSLNSKNWPSQMRMLLHNWDDMYWQLFSTERSDIDELVRAHANDRQLKLYFSDFDREFPDPSNSPMEPAIFVK